MKILISAAEASSDAHGAELLKVARDQNEFSSVQWIGMGGPKLRAAGLDASVQAETLLAMGFSEILGRFPAIFSAFTKLVRLAKDEQPDVAVLIDYPDFHFLLAKKLRKMGIPVVYFIPPKVWAWRKGRIRILRERFVRVLCILPFEETLYRKLNVSAQYVGNPLLDELPLSLTRSEARGELNLGEDEKVLVLMPGSRPSEMKRHFDLFLEASDGASLRMNTKIKVLIPLAETEETQRVLSRLEEWKKKSQRSNIDIQVSQGNSAVCLVAADVGLIKSGTSTLEAAILGCPHSIVYKPSLLTEVIFKGLIRYKGPVGLSNLVHHWGEGSKRAFREILMSEVTRESLTDEVVDLFLDSSKRMKLEKSCQEVRSEMLRYPESPSLIALRSICEVGRMQAVLPRKKGIQYASKIWSIFNRLGRFFYRAKVFKKRALGTRVISVGNIQAGGSGKTPIVGKIAAEAVKKGKKVCILTRGYRGEWEENGGVIEPGTRTIETKLCGDEAKLLHGWVPEAWIGVGKRRASQFDRVLDRAGKIDLVILDDGFQHWKVDRNLEVVVLTSYESDQVVYRESPSMLKHAHLLVWTKGAKRPCFTSAPLVEMRYRIKPNVSLKESKNWLITGIGQPEDLIKSVLSLGIRFSKKTFLADHHIFSSDEIQKYTEFADKNGYRIVLTAKDWVKWKEILGTQPGHVFVLELELNFESEEGRKVWNQTLWEESF